MYRIELAPGEETVFRTIEEFAVAVRNGLVSARSRIYHNATQKWLPIEFHPHYKKALELSAHRQDLPAARIPDSLDKLSFAVPRAPGAPTPPETPAEPPAKSGSDRTARTVAEHSSEPLVVERASEPPAERARTGPGARVQAHAAPKERPSLPAALPPAETAAPPSSPVPFSAALSGPYRPPITDGRLFDLPVIEDEPRAPQAASVRAAPMGVEAMVAVAVAEEPARPFAKEAPALSFPSAVASPVLQFPAIVYPEITPAEAPVSEPVTEAGRSRRPLQVAGAIFVLALGAYGMRSFAPSRAEVPMPAEADRPVTIAPVPAAPPPAPASSKPVSMTQPASSGFAPALEARATVIPSAAVPIAAAPAAIAKDSTLSPAPADLQLDLPALPGADSLLAPPKSQGDSAMKRILRAVNGGKDAPPSR
jgi:hypothetical protein